MRTVANDLKPLRSKMADTPEKSDDTSIRLHMKHTVLSHSLAQPKQLLPFLGNPRKDIPDRLQFEQEDYVNLVDWTGRIMQSNKGLIVLVLVIVGMCNRF
jgi:hypothetical protein